MESGPNKLSPGLHFDVPDDIYRADPGINQSLLKAFGRARSPAHFRYDQSNPPDPNHPSRSGIRIGSFVDARLFRGPNFADKAFGVWPGERKGSGWTAFKERNEGAVLLNGDENDRAHGVLEALDGNDDMRKILRVSSQQVVAIAEHPKLKFRMKGLIDLLPDPERCDPLLLDYAFDLKTAKDASNEGFAKACYDFSYDIQAAYYSDILKLLGREVKTFGFIVVENTPPHVVKIHFINLNSEIICGIPGTKYKGARKRYEAWATAYLNCVANNNWPGYPESWSEITYKPWMLRENDYEGGELQ